MQENEQKEKFAEVRFSVLSDAAPPAGPCLTQICCHSQRYQWFYYFVCFIGGEDDDN